MELREFGGFKRDRREMAEWVREGDPKAVLYLNDYDILTGKRLDDYMAHARGLLMQGVPIGGIGVQGHLHGDAFDRRVLKSSLETLAELVDNLAEMRIDGFTVVSPDNEVAGAVEGITFSLQDAAPGEIVEIRPAGDRR